MSLAVTGVRLAILESGLAREQVVPTSATYTVGEYVTWHWDTAVTVGPTWARLTAEDPPAQIYIGSNLFAGEPEAPAHSRRTMRITLEPSRLRLRVKERAPIVALRHVTDGTATWTEPIEGPTVVSDDERVAYPNDGVVYAKTAGRTVLRLEKDGLLAEAVVDVAAHPRGTLSDYITGLPPVRGLAWTPGGLIVSTQEQLLRRAGTNGKFDVIARLPVQPPTFGGSDTLAANAVGDLAVRLHGHRDLLILHASDDYASSHWMKPPTDGGVMGVAWDGGELVVGTSDGQL